MDNKSRQDLIIMTVIGTCIGLYTKSFLLAIAVFFFMGMLSNIRFDINEK